jgi:hypothetical protein
VKACYLYHSVFKPYIFENVEVSSLLESFASNTRNPHDKKKADF